ncbi:MAG: hypothetical protein KBS99_06760 [Prevotellaceae bacterium]|nr:hypothetical protein [Candidatus Colivivens caballi]
MNRKVYALIALMVSLVIGVTTTSCNTDDELSGKPEITCSELLDNGYSTMRFQYSVTNGGQTITADCYAIYDENGLITRWHESYVTSTYKLIETVEHYLKKELVADIDKIEVLYDTRNIIVERRSMIGTEKINFEKFYNSQKTKFADSIDFD